jgi:hypothetical protein
MAPNQHIRPVAYRLLLWRGDHRRSDGPVMSVVPFEALQQLSGYRQANKVSAWLREHGIRYVLNSSGKPVTVSDMLAEDLDGTRQTTTILFE